MPVFHYRGVARSGEVVAGTLETPDQAAAIQRLQAQGTMPIRVEERAASSLMALLDTEITPRGALSATDRIALTRTLATLTGAGLPLDRALGIAERLGTSAAVRAVAGRLLAAVREGARLADALDREPQAFPALYRSVVRAGEAGAALEVTLARLADTLEEQAKRRGELRSALIYPAFLLVTAIGAVAILLAYVVPTFEPLLEDAGVEPPAITQAVIAVGHVVSAGWPVMLAGLLAAGVVARLALRRPEIRLRWHGRALGLPVIGRLWRKLETARLCRLLGTLLENGVALPASLRLVAQAMDNAAFAEEVRRVTPEVEAGRGMAGPLAKGGLLPPLALQLLQVGEESGQLTPMLLKAAGIFETEAKREFDQALALLTPVLTLVMGVLIAVIISSILFALLSINELAL